MNEEQCNHESWQLTTTKGIMITQQKEGKHCQACHICKLLARLVLATDMGNSLEIVTM